VIALRALDPPDDRPLLERLWDAALGPVWPLAPGALDIARHGLVAEEDGAGLGVVVVDPAGSIPLLLVDPAHQRRGAGTRLLDGAMERLGELGAATVGLGSGGDDYLWPGVPDDLPAAVGFFAARGWRYRHTVIDLTADLRGYRAPAGVLERPAAVGVSIDVLAERDRAEVLAFEAATFPDWVVWFERLDASVLVARDAAGAVVGTLLFRGPPDATVYAPMLGLDAGTIGCVGVAEAARGAGVGTAMVARASELLRELGTGTCHIGWTRRERFYARVGYAPWRRYHMATRPVPASTPPRRRGPTTEEELRAAGSPSRPS
jgi:GNAT superfamily N-acetyltransferase